MKQMAKMQKKMTALQDSLAAEQIEVSGGGGAVTVTVSLKPELQKIRIDPELLKEEASVVEEVLLEAVQAALKEAGDKNAAAMEALTAELQGAGLPGLPGL